MEITKTNVFLLENIILAENEARRELFKSKDVKNLDEYNSKVEDGMKLEVITLDLEKFETIAKEIANEDDSIPVGVLDNYIKQVKALPSIFRAVGINAA